MSPTQNRVRQIVAVGLCWLPLLVLLVSVIALWETVDGTITTQWDASGPSTQAPAWTALLLPAGVCIITGLLATAYDGGNRGRRITYLFCFGAASAALWIWFCLVSANAGTAQPGMPNQILLFPFFVLLGFIPWAVVGRGAVEVTSEPESGDFRHENEAQSGKVH